jgi:hypothetical protein
VNDGAEDAEHEQADAHDAVTAQPEAAQFFG